MLDNVRDQLDLHRLGRAPVPKKRHESGVGAGVFEGHQFARVWQACPFVQELLRYLKATLIRIRS